MKEDTFISLCLVVNGVFFTSMFYYKGLLQVYELLGIFGISSAIAFLIFGFTLAEHTLFKLFGGNLTNH